MIQNLHTHTTFCDGKDAPEEMVRGAIAAGCTSLGFSGHAPMEAPNDWVMDVSAIPRYRAEVERLREAYAGQLEIFLGLELDYWSPPPGDGWDYLIGSVHCVKKDGAELMVDYTAEDFCQNIAKYYSGDCYAFTKDYYRLVGQAAERTGCQIVGHFDLITKFNEGDKLFDTAHPRYRQAALDALDALAAQDVIFEINTGAMSRGYRSAPYPAAWLLSAMRERGCRICITSDSHSAGTILHAFPQAAALAEACGYRETMVLTHEGFVPQPLAAYQGG